MKRYLLLIVLTFVGCGGGHLKTPQTFTWKLTVPGRGEPGRGEPGRGEPGRGEPGRGEPGRGEPGRGEPGRGEPGRGEPGRGEPGRGEPGRGEPGRGEPGRGEPGRAHQTGAEDVTIRAKFVQAPCTVFNGIPMTPDSPQKETCYLALTSTATQGDSFYPADVALMVFPQVYLMYVADSHLGSQALYYSGGTITGDTLLGTWQCHADTPVCFGAVGTVSGIRE